MGDNHRHDERVPAEPFVTWITAEMDRLRADDTLRPDYATEVPALGLLAARLEVTQRTLYRWARSLDGDGNPATDYARRTVENALHSAEHDFAELYPEIAAADDIDLEPDAYCDHCHEIVTPIDEACPWCDRPTRTELPRRMYCKRENAMRFPANNGGCWRCGGKLTPHVPRHQCGCGCGQEIPAFNDRTGTPKRYAVGHGKGPWGSDLMLPVEPFADWLEQQLRDLDPIQALARRVGLSRDLVLAILTRRETAITSRDVNRALRLASQEGQPYGTGLRPNTLKIDDIYPDRGGVLRCPGCGGRKTAKAERCRQCRLAEGWLPNGQAGRPTSMTPEILADARRLRIEQGLGWTEVARQLQPRTRCTSLDSVRTGLIAQFTRRGWPTSPTRLERAS